MSRKRIAAHTWVRLALSMLVQHQTILYLSEWIRTATLPLEQDPEFMKVAAAAYLESKSQQSGEAANAPLDWEYGKICTRDGCRKLNQHLGLCGVGAP